jgi:hypothetical protein
VSTDPYQIPNGYDPEKHRKLEDTIAKGDDISGLMEYLTRGKGDGIPGLVEYLTRGKLRLMACHEEHETPCIGWLWNQLGPGNNIALRIKAHHCTNLGAVKVIGPQHERFEDTLPK